MVVRSVRIGLVAVVGMGALALGCSGGGSSSSSSGGSSGGGSSGTSPISQAGGTIEAWTLGAGYTLKANVCKTGNCEEVGSSAISDTGQFSITFSTPTSAVLDPFEISAAGCMGSVTATPTPNTGDIEYQVFQGTTDMDIEVVLATQANLTGPIVGAKIGLAVYSDTAATVSGSISCNGGTSQYDIGVVQGWNAIYAEVTVGAPNPVQSFRAGMPTDLKWFQQ